MIVRLFCALVALALPVGAFLGARGLLERYEQEVTPWQSHVGPVFVDIPAGSSGADAVAALARAGVVHDVKATLRVLARSRRARELKAGEYRFDRVLAPAEVLGRLIDGDVFTRRITIPEGWNRFDIARRFESAGLGESAEFLAASARVDAIADLDGAATDLEGYLFPDTYQLGRGEGAEGLVRQMLAGFRAAIGPGAAERASAIGLSLREVVTLASLVEKETSVADERPLVAGVYHQRLRRGWLLQADPTIIYGLLLEGRYDGNLKRVHLTENAPYNTYVRRGLPPGPIANPGRASLDAAFSPAATDYLFFVSRNDGTHAFSSSLQEHNQKVETHQRVYWRDRWRRERAAGAR